MVKLGILKKIVLDTVVALVVDQVVARVLKGIHIYIYILYKWTDIMIYLK